MIITNIKWETDGEAVSLPTSVVLPDDVAKSYYRAEKEDRDGDGIIADHLSDEYGWLVLGFDIEE